MRPRYDGWRTLAAALTFLLLTGAEGARPHAEESSTWGFHLEWEHNGVAGTEFQLCVDGACTTLPAVRRGGGTWRAPLPMLPPGEHRLVVQACVGSQCLPGTPDLVVRVSVSSPRRPPIDVIEGPRIPVGGR